MLSHMPSAEQTFECHHAVWLEEAFHEQTHAKKKLMKKRLLHEHKWTDPESQLKMTQTQESFPKNIRRNSMIEDESICSLVSVRQQQLVLKSECSVAFRSNKCSGQCTRCGCYKMLSLIIPAT